MVSTLRRQLASSSIVAGDVVVPLCIFFGMKKKLFLLFVFFLVKKKKWRDWWVARGSSKPALSVINVVQTVSYFFLVERFRLAHTCAAGACSFHVGSVARLSAFPNPIRQPQGGWIQLYISNRQNYPSRSSFLFLWDLLLFTLSFRDGDKHLPLCRKRALLYGRAINNEIVSRRWKRRRKRDEERRSVVVVGGRPGKKTHSEGQTPETVRGPIKSQPEAATSCVSSPTNEPIDSLWAPGEKKRHRRMALFFPLQCPRRGKQMFRSFTLQPLHHSNSLSHYFAIGRDEWK